jgi:anaphase-promoting complex subunit 6
LNQEELKDWNQCLNILGDANVDEHGNLYDTNDSNLMYLDKGGEDHEINVRFPPNTPTQTLAAI